MSKLPKDAREEDFFYARPLPVLVAPSDPSKNMVLHKASWKEHAQLCT